MNALEILGADLVDQLQHDSKLRLLSVCGVFVTVDAAGTWSAKVGDRFIASPNQDEVINLALVAFKARRDLWPTWSPQVAPDLVPPDG